MQKMQQQRKWPNGEWPRNEAKTQRDERQTDRMTFSYYVFIINPKRTSRDEKRKNAWQ